MKFILTTILVLFYFSTKAQYQITEKQITLNEIEVFNQDNYQFFVSAIFNKITNGEIIAYKDSLLLYKINHDSVRIVKKDSLIKGYINIFMIENYIVKNDYVKLIVLKSFDDEFPDVFCYINSKDFYTQMKKQYFIKLFFEKNNDLSRQSYEIFTNNILNSILNKISFHLKENLQFDSVFYPYYQKPEGIYIFYKKKFGNTHKIKIHEISLFGNNSIRFFIIRRFSLNELNKILTKNEILYLKCIFYESI
jgi:hypothetical protein